jgi:outer membrane protein insertion porin family
MVRWLGLLLVSLLFLPSWLGAQELEGREVAEVRIEGNQNVPAESILLVMDTKPGRPFSAERLRQDLQAIYDMGFFAKAPVVLPMLTPEGRIIVVVRVFENPAVKAIVFEGNTAISSEKLQALMRTEVGKILNTRTLQRDLDRLEEFYQDSGFFAQIGVPDIRPDGTIVIPVLEARVISVKVDLGNKPKTKEKTVWREINLRPGQLFTRRTIEEDRRRLFLLDIFEDVNVDIKPADDPTTGNPGVEVTYRLKEKRTSLANAGLSYSSRNEIVGRVAVQDTNFRGTAQHLRLMVEFFDRKGFDFYYYRPWVDSKRTGIAINLLTAVSSENRRRLSP